MAYDNLVPFSFTKNGIYYFERRVPRDLSRHYSANKIVYSLRTRSAPVAASRATKAALQLDEYWYHLRLEDRELPGKHLLRLPSAGPTNTPATPQGTAAEASIPLSEAVRIYLRLKGEGKTVTFHRAAERACGYVIDACGDKDLQSYSRKDAIKFRDALMARGLSGSSITRVLGTVRAVYNFASSELGLEQSNPFSGIYYNRDKGVQKRVPLPIDSLRRVQTECRRTDDDLRWLVALVSDTGMRLAEAAGLAIEDFKLSDPTPHVVVQEHPWRRLKTRSSARVVPLTGHALWAAKRIIANSDSNLHAFPRYNRTDQTNANSASASLNKWMKSMTPDGCTMHSFRHSMRDRLRAVECPSDVVDQIGGWQMDGVGQSYGQGYPLSVLNRWLSLLS